MRIKVSSQSFYKFTAFLEDDDTLVRGQNRAFRHKCIIYVLKSIPRNCKYGHKLQHFRIINNVLCWPVVVVSCQWPKTVLNNMEISNQAKEVAEIEFMLTASLHLRVTSCIDKNCTSYQEVVN